MKKGIILITTLFIFLNLLYGCKKVNEVYNNKNVDNKTFIYSIDSIPNTLSPTHTLTTRENDIICSIFEGLVELNEKGEAIPALSNGWKISNNKIEYTFNLKEEIKWSDGSQIVADDFVNFFKNVLSSENKNYISEELYSIYGVKDYKEGKTVFDNVAIKALDSRTLIIRLNEPDSQLLKKLAKPIYRLRDTKNQLSNYKNQFSSIRYTGPYVITDVNEEDDIKLDKNKYYHDEVSYLNKITLRKKQGDEIEFAAYNIKKVDILSNPSINSFQEGELYKSITTFPSSNAKFLMFNTESGLGRFLDFRKGIMNALMPEIINSSLVKSKMATWAMEEIKYNNLINNKITKNLEYIVDNVEKRESLKNQAEILLSNINLNNSTINIVALDTIDNRSIGEFIEKLFKEKYSIKTKVTFLSEEKLEKILLEKSFDIYLKDINIENNDEIKKVLENNEKIFNKEYAIISLLYKNNIWCKSDDIKYLFIDGYGNILFKYVETI